MGFKGARSSIAIAAALLFASRGCSDIESDAPQGAPDAQIDASRPDSEPAADGAGDSAPVACWQAEPINLSSEAEKACDQLAAAVCERMDMCLPGEWHFGYTGDVPQHTDSATCRARMAINCPDQLALPGSPSPATLSACADALANVDCDDVFDAVHFGTAWEETPLTYASALHMCMMDGSRADGEPCDGSIQCASGYCLRPNFDADCGTCAPFKLAGEECVVSLAHAPCEVGLYCLNEYESGTFSGSHCEPYGFEGDFCPSATQMSNPSSSVGCERGLHCVAETCVPAAGEGESCAATNDQPPFCDRFQGLYCDPTTARCVFEAPTPMSERCYTPDGVKCGHIVGEGETLCAPPCLYPATQSFSGSDADHCALPAVRCSQ